MIGSGKPTGSSTPMGCLALLLLVFSLGGAASAQDQDLAGPAPSANSPVPLAPPVSLFPRSGASEQDIGRGGSEVVAQGVIAIRELDEVSSDSLGLMDVLSGGLPVDMWLGTPKELVDVLISKLPDRVSSEISRTLMRRLLLSVAKPPEPAQSDEVFVDMSALVPSAAGFVPNSVEGEVESFANISEAPDLGILERRVAQLARMGDWNSVSALVELVPALAVTETILEVRTDLALVEGGVDSACAEAAEQLSRSNNPYWQKVFAYCQLRDGNVAGAFLTIDLLREQGTGDAAFFWAAEIMAGNRPITPNGLRVLTPLQLAMLRSAGRPFPSQLVRDGDPTLLRVLAESEPLFIREEDDAAEIIAERFREALDARLVAAERAVGLGTLDPEVLRNLYRAEIFVEDIVEEIAPEPVTSAASEFVEVRSDDEEPDDLVINDLAVDTPMARARLFKLAEAQVIPTARAEVISHAIDFARGDRGRRGPDVGTMGRIYASLLREMTPAGDLDWFAGNAARALLGAGEIEAGRAWLELTQQYARTSIEAAEVSAAMWPIERQFQPAITNRFTPLRFKRWEDTRPSTRVAEDKTLVLSTLAALNETVTNEDWMSLMDRQSRQSTDLPSPPIWNGLTEASFGQRTGETVLLALISLGEDRLSNVSPIVLAHVMSSLYRIGLEEEARQIAIEAAISQGM